MTEWFMNSSVKLLTGADFNNDTPWILNDKRCAFVLFFADWCGHCQNFKPEYEKFADIAQFMHVYAINSENESNLMSRLEKTKLSIEGFPSLWIFKDGEPIEEYKGARTWQALLKKAKHLCNEKCNCDN